MPGSSSEMKNMGNFVNNIYNFFIQFSNTFDDSKSFCGFYPVNFFQQHISFILLNVLNITYPIFCITNRLMQCQIWFRKNKFPER